MGRPPSCIAIPGTPPFHSILPLNKVLYSECGNSQPAGTAYGQANVRLLIFFRPLNPVRAGADTSPRLRCPHRLQPRLPLCAPTPAGSVTAFCRVESGVISESACYSLQSPALYTRGLQQGQSQEVTKPDLPGVFEPPSRSSLDNQGSCKAR